MNEIADPRGVKAFAELKTLSALVACILLASSTGCRPPAPPPAAKAAASPQSVTVLDPAAAARSPSLTSHPLHFADVSRSAGITWQFNNGASGNHLFLETTGGGVAFLDYDNDGFLDIFAVQGGPLPGASGAARNVNMRSVLYRNRGDGSFEDVTAKAGLDGDLGYGMGVSVADFDNDGWPDLYITAFGGNHLFHNNRKGGFTDVTRRAGVGDARDEHGESPWPLSSAWGDYDNDGRLDLFVCHYCRWPKDARGCISPDGHSAYCAPEEYEPSSCRLYHNNGNGAFTDETEAAGIGRCHGKSMSAVWLDYDGDGRQDIFVTNDTLPNHLLHNNGNGTFTDRAIAAGVAYGDSGQAAAGMGIATSDYDRDGREDLFVVNFAGQPKSVFHHIGRDMFENASRRSGIAATNLQFLGFGLESFDYDNDGWTDLVVGNGHVQDRIDPRNAGSSYAQSQQLFHNGRDGTFEEDLRSLGDMIQPRVTRGLAVGDYDNDGGVDVLMVSQQGPLQLFRNVGGNVNGWVTIRLEGAKCNRDGYGARVTVHAANGMQTRWLHGSSTYCSHSDTRMVFGLGAARSTDSGEILWPDGRRQPIGRLEANHFYLVRECESPCRDPRVARNRVVYNPDVRRRMEELP